MELTRRDAVAALTALGVGGVAGAGLRRIGDDGGEDDSTSGDNLPDDQHVVATLVAAADVVYPSAVEGTAAFVETLLAGRLEREDHARGLRETVAELDEYAASWYDDRFAALDPADRDGFLREVGADTADEDPEGTTAERVRYYVVNELLFALYASPTGGKLVGIENPQGHPGGQDTYQRGPQS
jgi:hypothetical protein